MPAHQDAVLVCSTSMPDVYCTDIAKLKSLEGTDTYIGHTCLQIMMSFDELFMISAAVTDLLNAGRRCDNQLLNAGRGNQLSTELSQNKQMPIKSINDFHMID